MSHIVQNQGGNEMATAIAKIIRVDGRCPKNLQTDMENEWKTNVQKFLKKHNINHSTYKLFNVFCNESTGCRTVQSC